jgi:hypothetical protein
MPEQMPDTTALEAEQFQQKNRIQAQQAAAWLDSFCSQPVAYTHPQWVEGPNPFAAVALGSRSSRHHSQSLEKDELKGLNQLLSQVGNLYKELLRYLPEEQPLSSYKLRGKGLHERPGGYLVSFRLIIQKDIKQQP